LFILFFVIIRKKTKFQYITILFIQFYIKKNSIVILNNIIIDNKLYCDSIITIDNNNHAKYIAKLKYYHIDKKSL
jgi:hypothetical protein